MEFWLTDHDHGLSALSIRTEDNTDKGSPASPVISRMKLRGKIVTNIGVLSLLDLQELHDTIGEHLDSARGY